MEISKLLLTNYLPYAKSTILSRAIPGIDGLKPVQRRTLFAMLELNATYDKAFRKCARIVGDTMGKYHPHGDSSIYEALVLMTDKKESLNVPLVAGHGTFGKVYSSELEQAKMRYTEAKISEIGKELFEGINENAVDFRANFDSTEVEPVLLPTKFPNILVNSSNGIAVGTSSNIPSFSLNNVCKAVKGVITGDIKDCGELADVLEAPSFTTGGFIHSDKAMMKELCETGKGSFIISGRVEVYSDKIIITEIPYCTTVEVIMDEISDNIKNGNLKEIKDVTDCIDLDGLSLKISLKNNCNSREVLRKLCRYTSLRTSISFRTRVIIDNKCLTLNLLELIDKWIEFRIKTIQRIYEYRLAKDIDKEHTLSAWEKIKDHIHEAIEMISRNTKSKAKELLMSNYKMDESQASYILGLRLSNITTDMALKSLQDLEDIRSEMQKYNLIIHDTNEVKKIIVADMDYMISTYGIESKTLVAKPLTTEDLKEPEEIVSDELVNVVLTREGFIKRLTSTNDMLRKYKYGEDEEVLRWGIRNNEHLLVFDIHGNVHKIFVDDIDASRGAPKEKLFAKANLEKHDEILWADACGDYSGYFNLIYPNGRGIRVPYSKAQGKREKYKNLFDEVQPGKYLITQENQFLLVTARLKAAYCDISLLGMLGNRSAFKVARISPNDYMVKIIPTKAINNIKFINLEKYNKDYTVSIGTDIIHFEELLPSYLIK